MKNDALYQIPLMSIDGVKTTLKPYQGKVLLIVNLASRCGFTKQYADLQILYQEYHEKGLEVLGFPCNQFLHQEPGDNQEIKEFATSCFQVTFPLFAKIHVKGKEQSPLYAYLHKNLQKRPLKFIPWNFTKILVDARGNVLAQYAPVSAMKKIRQAIDLLLPS